MLIYIEQMTDWNLWPHCNYSQVYVDDIVIYSITLSEHIHHLHAVFNKLAVKRICLTSDKSFLDYLSVQLLEQQVDALELTTSEVKLIVITNLKFSQTLMQLERYLEMTDYLWQYISHYVAIVKSFQLCKTLLNQWLWQDHEKEVTDRNKWKWLADHISIVESISKELNTFHHLQILFLRLIILSHFDSKQQLYINLDASKEFDFSAHIYHVKSDLVQSSLDKSDSMMLSN